ncbi:unnamed protein product, partial [Choristocarpus tenellus]
LKYRGVHWAKGMFQVSFFDKRGETGKWITIGRFRTADEAARCYDRHARETQGSSAILNFPDS